MELLVTSQDIEPLPETGLSVHNGPSGILNSKYKAIVKKNFSSLRKPSLFSIKQRLKSKQYSTCCSMGAILKISLFVVGLILAYN